MTDVEVDFTDRSGQVMPTQQQFNYAQPAPILRSQSYPEVYQL